MEGALKEFRMPRWAIAFAVIALAMAAFVPAAGAQSPSQDQYGSALPGGGGGGGSPSGSGGGGQTTIPVAPSNSSSSSSGQGAGNSSAHHGGSATSGNGGSKSSHHHSNGGPSHRGKQGKQSGTKNPVTAQNSSHSVPQIAADSAGDGWVPFFIAGLVALGAAGAILVYRNRRRATQP